MTTKDNVIQSPSSVSPDGRWLVFTETAQSFDIWRLRLDGDRTPQPLLTTPAGEVSGKVSPDGHWLAFDSDVSGRREIYVQPFPELGPRRPVSSQGGREPLWSRDGRELFYQSGDNLMVVDVSTPRGLSISAPRLLFTGRYRISPTGISYSISADGRRFLRIRQAQPDRPVNRIDVVLGWSAQLKQLASAK